MRSLFFQDSLRGGIGPRLPVAHHEMPAGTWPHWHLQSVLLRRSAHRAGSSGDSGQRKNTRASGHKKHLGRTISGYLLLRALSFPQRPCDPQILSPCVKKGAEEKVSGPSAAT